MQTLTGIFFCFLHFLIYRHASIVANLQYCQLGVSTKEMVGEGLDLVVLQAQVGQAGQPRQQVAQRVQAQVVVAKLPGGHFHYYQAQELVLSHLFWAKHLAAFLDF